MSDEHQTCIGPGKYDDACTQLRATTGALAAIAIVIEGKHGNGFSVQAPWEVQARLPEILRNMADGIEKNLPLIIQEVQRGN